MPRIRGYIRPPQGKRKVGSNASAVQIAFAADLTRGGCPVPDCQALLDRLGETRVGLGSDFDGARVPSRIGSVAGLPALRWAMAEHGYGAVLIERICHGNWLGVLERTWGR